MKKEERWVEFRWNRVYTVLKKIKLHETSIEINKFYFFS
jgi:hypothetical protein